MRKWKIYQKEKIYFCVWKWRNSYPQIDWASASGYAAQWPACIEIPTNIMYSAICSWGLVRLLSLFGDLAVLANMHRLSLPRNIIKECLKYLVLPTRNYSIPYIPSAPCKNQINLIFPTRDFFSASLINFCASLILNSLRTLGKHK